MRSPKEMQMLIEKLQSEVATLKAQLIQNGLTPMSAGSLKAEASLAPAQTQPVVQEGAATPSTQAQSVDEESKDNKEEVEPQPQVSKLP